MILAWGKAPNIYTHANNTVWFNLHRRPILSPANRRYKVQETWHIKGVLTAASQSALTTAMQALESAYNTDGDKDLIFYFDDGVTETAHKRLAASTLNGLRVVQKVSWHAGMPGLWGAGIEYQRLRSFSVVVQAEYLDLESELLAYGEAVDYQLSGGDFVIQEVLSGSPERFDLQSAIRVVAVQRGFAVGAVPWPTEAAPLHPFDLRPRRSRVSKATPLEFGRNVSTRFVTRWHYHYESVGALTTPPALPTFP